MAKMNFKITNMHCEACMKLSEMALKKIPGVNRVEVENDDTSEIEADKEISREEIKNALAGVDKTVEF